MRYVILPIIGLLWLWWSYNAVSDIYFTNQTNRKYNDQHKCDDHTIFWCMLHIVITLVILGRLSYLYW